MVWRFHTPAFINLLSGIKSSPQSEYHHPKLEVKGITVRKTRTSFDHGAIHQLLCTKCMSDMALFMHSLCQTWPYLCTHYVRHGPIYALTMSDMALFMHSLCQTWPYLCTHYVRHGPIYALTMSDMALFMHSLCQTWPYLCTHYAYR